MHSNKSEFSDVFSEFVIFVFVIHSLLKLYLRKEEQDSLRDVTKHKHLVLHLSKAKFCFSTI